MRGLIPVVVLLGCGSKPDPDAVNALVDHVKNPKLHFKARDVTLKIGRNHEQTFAAVVPDDWVWDRLDEQFHLDPRDHGDGELMLTSSCREDPCGPVGDFKREFDDELAELIRVIDAKVLVNSSLPNERKFVTTGASRGIVVHRYWWEGEAPKEYFGCIVELPGDLEPSRAAFEKACDLVVVQK